VDVRVEENLLIIEAAVPENNGKEEEKLSWYIRERKPENLKRTFVLPEDVNRADVEAEMKNGVLTVNLRKKPESRPFAIKVQEK
jgi:HSP20 family protein